MLKGARVLLRPVRQEDWPLFESWAQERQLLWGAYQRHQLDHLPMLQQAYQHSGLLTRESGFLLITLIQDGRAIGFVRYTLIKFPDADFPQPEIGFGISDLASRGQGLASEAVRLLVDYLLAGYDCQRITAVTDAENLPTRRLLEKLGFQKEGGLRAASFRDGAWHEMLIYGLLRGEWEGKP